MKYLLTSLGITSMLAAAGPTSAAVIFEKIGQTAQVGYEGKVGGSMTDLVSAQQTFTLTDISADKKTYTLSYSLDNTSANSSRLRSFGFDVHDATAASIASTGAYSFSGVDQNFPEGVGTLSACFAATANGNCTGGPKGLLSGGSALGTISLKFATSTDSFSLDNFTTRFQSIAPSINGESSGVAIGHVAAVPEASTWAMMIMGVGFLGFTMRRRKTGHSMSPALAA